MMRARAEHFCQMFKPRSLGVWGCLVLGPIDRKCYPEVGALRLGCRYLGSKSHRLYHGFTYQAPGTGDFPTQYGCRRMRWTHHSFGGTAEYLVEIA